VIDLLFCKPLKDFGHFVDFADINKFTNLINKQPIVSCQFATREAPLWALRQLIKVNQNAWSMTGLKMELSA